MATDTRAYTSLPTQFGRAIFGQAVLGHTLAYILALACMVLGVAIGMNISQPAAVLQPTRDLVASIDDFDKLLALAPDDPRDISGNLDGLRAKMLDLGEAPLTTQKAAIVGQLDDLDRALRQQILQYQQATFQTRRALEVIRSRLQLQIRQSDNLVFCIYDQLRRFMKWTGPTVFGGLLGVVLIILALCHPKIRQFLGKSGSISFGGVTLNFQDLQAVRESVQARIKALDADISKTYIKNLQSAEIEAKFADVKADLDQAFLDVVATNMSLLKHRATLFVPGFTGDELVQATGYLGVNIDIRRYGAGRRFSVRYGMIGKAWRLRFSQYNPSVDNVGKNLIRNFGLTQSEADRIAPRAAGRDRQKGALMSFAVRDTKETDSDPLGVIYIESFTENALAANQDVAALLQPAPGDPDGMSGGDVLAERIWTSIAKNDSVVQLIKTLMQLRNNFDWDAKLVDEPGR